MSRRRLAGSALALLACCVAPARAPLAPTGTPIPHGGGGVGALPAPRAAGPELEATLERLRSASDDEAPAAMLALALSDDPAAADHLLLELAGPRAAEAASAFAVLGGEAAAQSLLVALDHVDPTVRLRAASGLRALHAPETAAPILAFLRSGRAASRETCLLLLSAAARAARGVQATEVRTVLDHLPASCDVGPGERAVVEWNLASPEAPAAALRALTVDLDDDEMQDRVLRASDPATLTVARALLAGSARADAIVRAALVLSRADDAAAREVVHGRLGHPDVAACDVVSPGLFGAGDVMDRGACDELRALLIAAGLLSDPRDLPLLQRLSTPPRTARGRPQPAAPSPLVEDALYARALHAGSAADPELARLLDEGGRTARALARNWPRVAGPVAASVAVRAAGGAPLDVDGCFLLLEWEDPRRLDAGRTMLRRDDVPPECRPWAGVILARHGTDDDRQLVATVVASRIAEPEAAAGTPGELPGRMPVVWARVAAELPPALRPDWSIVRAALANSAPLLVPKRERETFFPTGTVERGALEAIGALRASRASAPAPALLRLVRARTAAPRVAGPALGGLLRGASDGDVEALLRALLPQVAEGPERQRRARAEELGRLLAAALASRDARARAGAARRLGAAPLEARTALARLALAEPGLPPAELVVLLDDPSPLAVAALALRCDRTCVPAITERLGSSRTDTRAAAAVVAGAMEEPALADALLEVAHGEGAAAAEAAVALTLLHRVDEEGRQRMEEAEAHFGFGEGLPGRIALARTLEGLAPPWGDFRGAGLWSCGLSRGELPASDEGRQDPRGALATAAVVLRAHPRRLAALSGQRLVVATEDLQQALACLGDGLDVQNVLAGVGGGSSVALRRLLAPALVEAAARDPASPLLEQLARDADATVRERVASAFRAGGLRAVRPFGALLARLARDPSAPVRQAAMRALPLGDFESSELLLAALQDPAPEVRRAVLENPDLSSSHATDRVAALADDPDPSVRLAAAAALGDVAFAAGLPGLRRLVADERTRAAALPSLCRRGVAADLPRVLDAFRRLAAGERQTARFAFATAGRLLGSDPSGAVRHILADRDPETARLAVVMMSIVPLPEAIDTLEAGARHRFPSVRREVAGLVTRLHLPGADADPALERRLRTIGQRLLQDADPSVKCRALVALAPGELPQDELDALTGEAGVSVEMLRDRWGCASLPMFD